MNFHEYQARELFAQFGIPVPQGVIANLGGWRRAWSSNCTVEFFAVCRSNQADWTVTAKGG